MNQRTKYSIITLTLIICLLVVISSSPSLINQDFYKKEAMNWQIQSNGQDIINLFCVIPFLLASCIFIVLNRAYGVLLWLGCLLYLAYTYTIFCFDIHFNQYFIIYCVILGLCFYLFCYLLITTVQHLHFKTATSKFNRITGTYFLIISLLFYSLWFKDIIPSLIKNSIPNSLAEAGLFTNPVHVLDLSIFLPGIFIVGVLIFKKRKLGYLIAPIILTFFVLMNLTIAILTIIMNGKGIAENMDVAFVMFVLGTFSSLLLAQNFRFFNYSYENN